MKSKWIMVLTVVLAVAVGLSMGMVGCKSTTATTEAAATTAAATTAAATTAAAETTAAATEAKAKNIGLVLISGINSHCQELEKGVKSIVEPKGDKVITLDSQFDTSKELQCLEDLISQKVDGIVLEVLGFETSQSALEGAKKANILVVGNDQLVKADDLVVSQTISDSMGAGTLCAQDLVKKMGETGEVLVVNIPGVTASDMREKGFVDEIAKYPGIKIVATINGEGLVDKAAAATEAVMQAHPNIKAVFGINDPCAIGALTAFIAAGKNEGVFFYGVDGSADAFAFIKDGKMTGSVKQNPFDLGTISTIDLYKAFAGETIENRAKVVPVTLVNSDNIGEFLK